MGDIVVCTNLSLDGVMQGPARPDEDTRGGFARGGWAAPYAAMVDAGSVFSGAGALLLGRRTFEDFAAVWPQRESPFTGWLNAIPKYVASATLHAPLAWENARLLAGDAVHALPHVARETEKDILILGSGELIRSLLPHNLISCFVLLIHPLVLGEGRRLFPETGANVPLKLIDTRTTATGVVIGTYEPA